MKFYITNNPLQEHKLYLVSSSSTAKARLVLARSESDAVQLALHGLYYCTPLCIEMRPNEVDYFQNASTGKVERLSYGDVLRTIYGTSRILAEWHFYNTDEKYWKWV